MTHTPPLHHPRHSQGRKPAGSLSLERPTRRRPRIRDAPSQGLGSQGLGIVVSQSAFFNQAAPIDCGTFN